LNIATLTAKLTLSTCGMRRAGTILLGAYHRIQNEQKVEVMTRRDECEKSKH